MEKLPVEEIQPGCTPHTQIRLFRSEREIVIRNAVSLSSDEISEFAPYPSYKDEKYYYYFFLPLNRFVKFRTNEEYKPQTYFLTVWLHVQRAYWNTIKNWSYCHVWLLDSLKIDISKPVYMLDPCIVYLESDNMLIIIYNTSFYSHSSLSQEIKELIQRKQHRVYEPLYIVIYQVEKHEILPLLL